MSAQECYVTGQTEGRREAFLQLASLDHPLNFLLHKGGNVNYYKSLHHSISTLPVGIGSTLAIFKTNQ